MKQDGLNKQGTIHLLVIGKIKYEATNCSFSFYFFFELYGIWDVQEPSWHNPELLLVVG